MNTTPNENNENLENENVAEVEIEETAEAVTEEETTAAEEIEEITEEAVEAAEEVIEEAVASEEISGEEAVEPISEEATEDAPKKCKKAFGFTGLIALILVCAFLWVMYSGIFAPKYAPSYDNSDMSALYILGDELKARKDNGKIYTVYKNTTEVSAEGGYSAEMILEGTSLRSPNGEALYFYENFDLATFSGDLYVSYNDKAKEKIDTGVSTGLMCSADGRVALYPKLNQESETPSIAFYLYRKGKAPVLLADNTSMAVAPILSQTAKYIAYCVDNAETQKTDLYVVKSTDKNLKPVKLAEGVSAVHAVKDNGYVFYTVSAAGEDAAAATKTVYYASAKKGAVKVADNAIISEKYIAQQTNNFGYLISKEDGTVDFFVGKIGKAAEKIYSGTNLMLNPDIENNHYIFITPQQEDANLLDITTMFGKKAVPVGEGASRAGINYIRNSRDFKKMCYMKNYTEETMSGELYYAENKFGSVKPVKVADGVNLAAGSEDMEYIVYFTNIDLQTGVGAMHVFDGKKSKKIADNVAYFSFTDDDKKIYYLTNCSEDFTKATLNIASLKNPSKKMVVDKEISLPSSTGFLYSDRDDGSVYYMKNYDASAQKGDLYFAKNGKTGTLVEKGVSKLILE